MIIRNSDGKRGKRPESTVMEKARINLPLIILTGLPAAAASAYLLLQPRPILAVLPPLLLPVLLWLGHRPLHAFYLIVILIPFNAWRELMSQYQFVTLSKLLGVFLMGVLLLRLVENPQRIQRIFSKIWLLLAVFSAVAVVSSFYSAFASECADNLRMLATAYLFLAFTLFFIRAEQLKTEIPVIIALSSGTAAFIAVAGYAFRIEALMLTSDPGIISGRVLGSASNPNLMAATLLVGIPFIVFLFFESRSIKGRLLWLSLFLVNSGAVALSYSRSMLLVYAMLLAILIVDNLRRFQVRYTGFVAVLAAALLLYGAVKIPQTPIWERLITLSAPRTDTSLLRRASYVLAATDAVKQHPVIGAGPGTFPLIYQHSPFASAFAEDAAGYARSAHNTYLEVAVGTGGMGLLLFLAVFISTFIGLYRTHKRIKRDDPRRAALIRSIAWALLAFLMALMFASQLYHKYIWLLLGLSAAAGRIPSTPNPEDNATAAP